MDWILFIAEVLLPLIGGVLVIFVVPLIRDKTQSNYTKQLVTAAEQIYRQSGLGAMKRDYVAERLQQRWNLDETQVEILIEAAVGELGRVWDAAKE